MVALPEARADLPAAGRPLRVLVTYGWCRTAYVAVRSLSRAGHTVHACSHHTPSMAGWSRFCHGSSRVADPFLAPQAFARDVADLVTRWRIDVVLPGHEDGLILRRHESILPSHVRLACPERTLFEQAIDKAWITQLASQAGVPVPATRFPGTLDEALGSAAELGYPLLVKLRRSNSGKGVVATDRPEQLRDVLTGRFARYCGSRERFPILQQFVDGGVIGACFIATQGRLEAVFQERYLRCKGGAFGTSVFRERLAAPPALEPSVEKLAAAMRWHGLGHFDFILERATGIPRLLEMNPRLWGAINLAWVNGYDFPAALLAQLQGEISLGRYFHSPTQNGHRSLWVIGECIAMVNRLRARDWPEIRGALSDYAGSVGRLRFDDCSWHDPLPLLAEALCYARLFYRSGGDTNPAVEGMLE